MSQQQRENLISMTGFASVRGKVRGREFFLESKSVNHRFCEVNVRMPGRFSSWEHRIQKMSRAAFRRGRIDIFIKEEGIAGPSSQDWSQFKKAHRELKRLARELKLSDTISLETVLHFKQNYFKENDNFDASSEWHLMRPLVDRLLNGLAKMRRQEGRQLAKWFRSRLPIMQRLLRQLKLRASVQTREQERKLKKRVKELGLGRVDAEQRITAEIGLLADKLDVTEEVVRLETHLKAFQEILRGKEPVGRKIDFLMQEVSREINTVASKSQDSQIAKFAVQFKTEIEKIREQASNVE